MTFVIACVVWVLVVLSPITHAQWTFTQEAAIRNDLLIAASPPYNNKIRPSVVTSCSVDFFITSVNEVNIKDEAFGISGWWYMTWYDDRLSWATASYSGIGLIVMGPDEIWHPTIVQTSSIDNLAAIEEITVPMRVEYDGFVSWRPPGISTHGCDMDTTYFPYDMQECSVEITVFGYTNAEMNMSTLTGFRFDYYEANGEWKIVSRDASQDEVKDYGLAYTRLTLTLTLKRLASVYWFAILIPIVLNSFLVPIAFLLPPSSGERNGFGLTVLLAFVVLLTMVTAEMPTSSKTTSLLEVYIIVVLFLSCFSVLFTIYSVMWFNIGEEEEPPNYLQKMAEIMKIMMLQKTCNKEDDAELESQHNTRGHVAPMSHRATPQPVSVSRVVTRIDIQMKETKEANDSEGEKLTYPQLGEVLDAFLLRAYMVVLTVLTVVVFLILILTTANQSLSGTEIEY